MKRSMLVIIIAVLVFAVTLGIAYLRSAPGVDAGQLVSTTLLKHNSGSYTANVVTTTQHRGQTLRSFAKLYHDGENERIEQGDVWSLTIGKTTYTCIPRQNATLISVADERLSDKERVKLVLNNYRITVEGSEEVAGRKVYIAYLQPKSESGPSKRLWIDSERFVILKSINYSATGEKQAQMQITRIGFDVDIDQLAFKYPENKMQQVKVSEPAAPQSVARKLNITVSNPKTLPEGYVLEGTYLYKCQCDCGHYALLTTYTDGLNTISVFQSPSSASCNSGTCKTGGHDCVVQKSEIAKLGQTEKNGKTIVVVADLLPDDIRRITTSIK